MYTHLASMSDSQLHTYLTFCLS